MGEPGEQVLRERAQHRMRDTMPVMQIGIILPQNEIGDDPGAIREFSATAEDEGFEHVVAFDHVVGKDDYASQPFHEPFVLFGFIAACTRTIELVTGIIILPQRQTALAAKQAAEVDMLSGGRLRLGLGVGWNPLEYEALGEDFHTRGKRMDAQIPLMQRLWSERRVTAELGREQPRTTSASTRRRSAASRSGSAARGRRPCAEQSRTARA